MPTGRGSRMEQLKRDEDTRRRAGGARATALETRTDEARGMFDAAAAARETAAASFADMREEMGRGIESLRGHQVGRGRLDTGFGMEDEDRLVMDFQDRLSRDISHQAFTAAGMNLRNIEGGGREAGIAREQDLALLTGATDREQARINEKNRRRRGRFGMLGGVAGAAIGSLGGLPGAELGAKIGSSVGSSI